MPNFLGVRSGRGLAFVCLAGTLSLLATGTASAHPLDGVGLRASCVLSNINNRAEMVVSVVNTSGLTLVNTAPTELMADSVGTAEIYIQTYPRAVRSLLPDKSATFKWKGLLFGDGLLDLSTEVLTHLEDGDTVRSGIVNCNRLAVGDTSGVVPPPSPTAAIATPTGPVVVPTSSPTTGTAARPTRTPIPARPTRTPVFTSTPRPTRTRPGTVATHTPSGSSPTATRAATTARTRVPTYTVRPTRTPIPARPTRTPAGGSPGGVVDENGLQARCSLRRTVDLVQITMLVANRTGVELTELRPGELVLDADGRASFFDQTGPSPRLQTVVPVGSPVTFQWSGRLSAGGSMGFRTSATAVAPGGRVVGTGSVDCGVATADDGSFDPSEFAASCQIAPDERNARLTLTVQNRTDGDLTNVEPLLRGTTNSGTAQIIGLNGPGPRLARRLAAGQSAEFVWRGRTIGSGDVSVRLEALGTRPNGERVSTGTVTCSVTLTSPGGGLPDLTLLETDLRESILIETRDFARDNCAVLEGCVAAPGTRRLLRFTTTTPNLGPGDVFFGDPAHNPLMTIDACHGHYHFDGYAAARLLDSAGNVAASGHKASFCLIDLWPLPGSNGRRTPQFTDCGYQGISAGWADVYHRNLDCQWVDITGVPPGRYALELEVNPDRSIAEGNYSNNRVRVEVVVP